MNTKDNMVLDVFIAHFVLKDKRERIEHQLKNPKLRAKFTDKLNHKWHTVLDMRYLSKIPRGVSDDQFTRQALDISDGELCYIISNHSKIDGLFADFKTAFDEVYGRNFGSLIVDVSGKKLYLETEVVQGRQNRFIGRR
jgi:hypothetical protein